MDFSIRSTVAVTVAANKTPPTPLGGGGPLMMGGPQLNADDNQDDSDDEEYDDDSDWDEDEESDDESEEQISITVQVGNKSHKFVRDPKGRFAKAE